MATNKDLEFIKGQSYTVDQFMLNQRVTNIYIKEGKTGGLFFQFGGQTGAVSKNGIPAKPMISLVKGEPNEYHPDGKFWLMHEMGEGGAPVVRTFSLNN